MAKSYSSDLPSRVVAYVEAGYTRRAAARRFGVSDSFAVKLLQRVAEHGTLSPGRQGRPRGGRLAAFEDFLVGTVERQSDITMPELAVRLLEEHTMKADPAVLSRLLCRCGIKKRCWRRNANALTSPKPGTDGGSPASPACAISPAAWSLSTKPRSPQR
jgi:transposase